MKTANLMIAAAAISLCGSALCGPAAFAQQQGIAGTITGINRLNGTVAIQPAPSETVGSSATAPAPVEEFKVKDGAMLDAVHAGDRITYAVGETGGAKTITKLEKQK